MRVLLAEDEPILARKKLGKPWPIETNRRGGSVELSLRDAGQELILFVVNTGALMNSDEVAKIVEPFHRGVGRLPSRDNGLGAALVAAIITRHGWQLRLRPGAEAGSRRRPDRRGPDAAGR